MSKLLRVLALLVFLLGAASVSAQDRVRVGWAAMTASHTPLWVAQEKGFLTKQGLLVESIFFGAGPPAMQALVAGDLDIVVTSAPNVVNPRLGGADVVMVLSIIPTFIDHIISAASINNPEQLKGKIGSVNRFGSISDMGLRLSLKKLGIDPEKDVRIVPAGGNPERLAAISKGISQFTIMNEPFIKEAERLGFRDLVNMATLKIPLHGNGVVTREAIIKTRRPVIAKFTRAITEAIHYIKARQGKHESNHRQVYQAHRSGRSRADLSELYFRVDGCALCRSCRHQNAARRHGTRRAPKLLRRIQRPSSTRASFRKWRLRGLSSNWANGEAKARAE